MATEKKINSRIQQKHDVAANWAKATNFIPQKGEIIIYDAEYNASGEETQAVRFKIGDGSKTVNNLPFAAIDYKSIKSINTNNTAAQAVNTSEAIAGSGTINLHKVAKTGSYNDLLHKPTIPAVNNGALTLTVNGTAHTFTANQSGDTSVTINDTGVTSVSLSGDGNAVTNASIDGRALTLTKGTTFLTSHQSIKSINTNNTAAQEPKTDESIAGSGTINLHKIAKTGNYNDLLHKPTLGTAAEKNVGTSSGNVPILDSNGKLADSVIPAVAITDTYVIDTEEEMLALSAQKGDIAIRSDLNKSYVLQTTPASTLANWKELLTPTDTVLSVNGQTGTVELTASDVKALPSSTKYAASSEVGGAATSANKVNSNLIVKLNSGATEGTNLFTFNGSAAKTINITPSAIGAAASSHGTHVTADTVKSALGTGSGTSKYLREDGTWQTPPNTATAADNLLDGSNSGTQITYAPYTSQQSKLSFDSSNTEPTRSDRLNLNGYLHATKLYSGGKEVLTSHQDISGKLDKTTYEWNKEFAAGSNGAISLGRYNIYDTQLTFDISSTTSASMSGKLVIATQNGKIIQAKVFGDATGALVSKIVIYQSSIINNRSWVEVFCNFDGWSKNKVHIYGVALNSSTVTNQMSSVTFTNGVPSPITSGDSKWNGTIDNDLSGKQNKLTAGSNITISGNTISANAYVLPSASPDRLGGIKISFSNGVLTITT